MIECVIAWTLLFYGIFTTNSSCLIAAGVFAVASQIDQLRKEGRR